MDTTPKPKSEDEWNGILYDGILPMLNNIVEQFIKKEKKAKTPFKHLAYKIAGVLSLFTTDLYRDLGLQPAALKSGLKPEHIEITRRIVEERKAENVDKKVVVAYVNSLSDIIGFDKAPDDDLDKVLEILRPYSKPISDSQWESMYKRLWDDYKKRAKAHNKWR